jgi:hypothetical protein
MAQHQVALGKQAIMMSEGQIQQEHPRLLYQVKVVVLQMILALQVLEHQAKTALDPAHLHHLMMNLFNINQMNIINL